MIKLYPVNSYLKINEGYPYIYSKHTGSSFEGHVRYDFTTNMFQIFDGATWQNFNKDFHIDLAEDAQACLTWVKQKIIEEQRLSELMEKHPELKDQYERFKIIHNLVKEHENEN